MRILLTGAGGQLGRALQVALERHQLIALERRELDITDPAAVREALRRHRPELVLNAAAYTRVDGAESEPEAAFAVNAEGPRHLAKASAAGGIALLHMSTDYVFDGTANCPYDESAPANPRSVYGASKLAGEQAVREHNPRHLIVRTAWLYHTVGHNFPTTMLALAGRGEVRVVDDQRGSPTYAPHLTAAIARLIESGAAGIYHLAGTRHGPGSLPLTDAVSDGFRQQHWQNTIDYRPVQRAILLNLDRWVRESIEPPPSLMPRIGDGTAVRRESLREVFMSIPGMGFLKALPVRRRLDFGPEMDRGLPHYPPKEGEPFVTLVSGVDDDGNEVAGIRLPDVSVPLGTYTGWTMRHPDTGAGGQFIPLQGAVLPFPRSRQERQALGDPRPALEERYGSKDEYLGKVRAAVQDLVRERYILEEDVDRIVAGAAARWDAFHAVEHLSPMLKDQVATR